jgi:hypothetical protein
MARALRTGASGLSFFRPRRFVGRIVHRFACSPVRGRGGAGAGVVNNFVSRASRSRHVCVTGTHCELWALDLRDCADFARTQYDIGTP